MSVSGDRLGSWLVDEVKNPLKGGLSGGLDGRVVVGFVVDGDRARAIICIDRGADATRLSSPKSAPLAVGLRGADGTRLTGFAFLVGELLVELFVELFVEIIVVEWGVMLVEGTRSLRFDFGQALVDSPGCCVDHRLAGVGFEAGGEDVLEGIGDELLEASAAEVHFTKGSIGSVQSA
jgi:hypothetical protein